MYIYDFVNKFDKKVEKKKSKGNKRSAMRSTTIEHYKRCNFEEVEEYRIQNIIRSYKHEYILLNRIRKH